MIIWKFVNTIPQYQPLLSIISCYSLPLIGWTQTLNFWMMRQEFYHCATFAGNAVNTGDNWNQLKIS